MRLLSGVIFKISAAFLAGALVLISGALWLSGHYTAEERRLAAAGDMKAATEASQKSVRLDPFGSAPLEAQSFLFLQRGMDEESAKSLQEAMERNPNDYMTYFLLGNLQVVRQNDLDAAIDSYRKALKLNPKLSSARSGLAQALLKQGKLEEAKTEYEKLQKDKGISYQGLYDLGRINVRTGDAKEGAKDINKAMNQASRDIGSLKGELKSQREDLIQSMTLALADALVVQRHYTQAAKVISGSSSDQAPALLELLNADPESYRESVINGEIY